MRCFYFNTIDSGTGLQFYTVLYRCILIQHSGVCGFNHLLYQLTICSEIQNSKRSNSCRIILAAAFWDVYHFRSFGDGF